jgi:hypothetical protein
VTSIMPEPRPMRRRHAVRVLARRRHGDRPGEAESRRAFGLRPRTRRLGWQRSSGDQESKPTTRSMWTPRRSGSAWSLQSCLLEDAVQRARCKLIALIPRQRDEPRLLRVLLLPMASAGSNEYPTIAFQPSHCYMTDLQEPFRCPQVDRNLTLRLKSHQVGHVSRNRAFSDVKPTNMQLADRRRPRFWRQPFTSLRYQTGT